MPHIDLTPATRQLTNIVIAIRDHQLDSPGDECALVVPADAPVLDRVLGLTGRDPGWAPS